MHEALHVQEILLDIFHHVSPIEPCWTPYRRQSTGALAALARTCRTFKEPALDVLWSVLVDLTPLMRCVPQACCVREFKEFLDVYYLFQRRLSVQEWKTLLSYTRRIRHVLGETSPDGWLRNNSLEMIYNPPSAHTLFPNLQSYHWKGTAGIPPTHIVVPSLMTLDVDAADYSLYVKSFINKVADLRPNIRRFCARLPYHSDAPDETICNLIRRLTNLEELECHGIILDDETVSHLAERSLRHLLFSLGQGFCFPSPSILTFPTLKQLDTTSESLETVTRLFSCIRLPVIKYLHVIFTSWPSRNTFGLHMMAIQTMCASNSLTVLRVHSNGRLRMAHVPSDDHRLVLDDFHPFMTFVNLYHLYVNLPWRSVDLTDDDLLALVSAWPHIQTLRINDSWGWGPTVKVTLRGLLQLFQARPTLSDVGIAIRTESYKDILDNDLYPSVYSPPLIPLRIDLADSLIQPADAPSLVDMFWKLGWDTCDLVAWKAVEMYHREGADHHELTWKRVFNTIKRGKTGEDMLNEMAVSGHTSMLGATPWGVS